LLLPSTCSRASLKTDAFAYNHSTLIQIAVEEKNLMPVTTLDPKTALIVVDLQKGIINSPFIHPVAGVIERNRALLDVFRQRDLPVVLVNVAGGAPGRTEQPRRFSTFPEGFSDLIPELDRQASDIVVTKRTWGAFASTDLEAQLKANGVTQVVVTGVATGTGVEATARQAYEQGFHVTLALDAMSDVRPEAHEYSLASVFPRLGERGSTHDILTLLATRSA
jgi:nicotinamidase-related amidase